MIINDSFCLKLCYVTEFIYNFVMILYFSIPGSYAYDSTYKNFNLVNLTEMYVHVFVCLCVYLTFK